MKNLNLLLIICLTLTSCASVSDAGKVLRNEKVKTTDEFLVKKKEPLVLPPDYNEVPKPGSLLKSDAKELEKNKIKKILRAPKEENVSKKNSSSIEESILNKIRK